VFAFSLLMAAISTHARAQALTARQVLEKAVTALGGRERLERIQSRSAEGKIDARGITGSYQLWAKAPGKLKTRMDLVIQQVERGFDGADGWEKRFSVRELSETDQALLKQRAVFNPLLSYLNSGAPLELKEKSSVDGHEVYVLRIAPAGETPVLFYLDAASFLPLRQEFQLAAGQLQLDYADYRKVRDVLLPFAVTEVSAGQKLSIRLDRYLLDEPLQDSLFENPLGKHRGEPYEVSLSTIPLHVYRENDGLQSPAPTESWLFHVLVKEKYGRLLEPKSAVIELYSGPNRVQTLELSTAALTAARRLSFQGGAAQEEVFDLRHQFSEPVALKIDRLVYSLELTARGGQTIQKRLEIPVSAYEQKTGLIFPLKGNFVVLAGHELNEAHKTEWSQFYGYDVVGLGEHYEIVKGSGESNADFYGWGREIIAPADGLVVYARNDVADNARPGEVQTNIFIRLPDPLWTIAGNVVVIDHGNGEYSLLAHMQKGSVRVKTGDRAKQGAVLGLLGNSGNSDGPHLHYHLMAGRMVFRSDGLPSRFENLEVPVPKRGIYLEAK
jgi:murein DD-endopeptidase MepM/ murein hydrolase activator NlpD